MCNFLPPKQGNYSFYTTQLDYMLRSNCEVGVASRLVRAAVITERMFLAVVTTFMQQILEDKSVSTVAPNCKPA